MNLLHITPYYAPAYAFGGVVRAAEGMTQALARRGHHLTVLTTDALSQHERYQDDLETLENGVRVVRVRNLSVWLRGRMNLSTPLNMRRTAKELVSWADVVHCHEFRTSENLLVTPLAEQMSKPLILSPHGTLMTHTGRGGFKVWWDRLLSPPVARRFDTVIGLAAAEVDDARALWKQLGSKVQFAVVPNGVEPETFTDLKGRSAFRAKWGIGEHERVCLFLGRLHPRKGIDVLIRAFNAVNVPDSRLVIAGPDEGMMMTIKSLLYKDINITSYTTLADGSRLPNADIELDKRVILTGYLNSEERLAALAAADVFALPATGEGLSMAVLEAMAASLPVVISPGCNLPEAAEAGAGLVVEPQDAPLAMALRELLNDKERQRQMGANARQLVLERFTWARVAEQLEQVYQRVLL